MNYDAKFDRPPGRREPPRDALTRAIDLYTGPLLAGMMDPWIDARRETLHERFADAAHTLAEHAAANGRPDEAIALVERVLTQIMPTECRGGVYPPLYFGRGRVDPAPTWT